jgi:preprotein translocase SecE subunit
VVQPDKDNQKPRVRKSAPTVRERMEAARAKEEADSSEKRLRIKPLATKAKSPFNKLHLRDRKATRAIARPLKPVAKVLSFLAPRYLINSWKEVRQVQWPNRRETWRLTLAVGIFAVVFGALVAGVDKGLDELFKKVILK